MKNTLVIAKYTFIEVYRSKIMYGLLVLAIALFVVTYIASEFAYGAPDKIALDFSIGIMSISNLIISIFLGATLLSKEIESRTLYMILSRPLSRNNFLIGKVIGLSSVILINSFFLTLVGSVMFNFLGGVFSKLLLWVVLFSFFESLIIMLFGVLFSLITNITMAVMFTILVLICGHTITETMSNFFAKTNVVFSKILSISLLIIPDLERLNLKDFLIYNQSLPGTYLGGTLVYVLFYLAALTLLISFVFKRKNLD
jgi:ABC-type transport system involved in multi-copper enzyme maturation permease subunit